jgi:hypothetical protein
VTGWQGTGDLMSKFGLDIQDRFTFQLSKTRWDALGTGLARPREGDVLYWPMVKALFEIKFVENEAIFYQTGTNHMYELQCEKYVYNQEPFVTDDADVNAVIAKHEYHRTVLVNLTGGSGTFVAGEMVYQGVSSTAADAVTAIVQSWDPTTGTLVLVEFKGDIALGQDLVGTENGAHYPALSIDSAYSANNLVDNSTLNTRDDDLIDFSQTNVFSEQINQP